MDNITQSSRGFWFRLDGLRLEAKFSSFKRALQADMSYGLKLGWGGLIGDYIGFWGGPIQGYATNLVQGSHGSIMFHNIFAVEVVQACKSCWILPTLLVARGAGPLAFHSVSTPGNPKPLLKHDFTLPH